MANEPRALGILRPVGGGDPIPLLKDELTIGRRRTCDIWLDFENVSGKHCVLRLENGVWFLRDLGSTNGTTLNGATFAGERGVMPDDEVGVASHLYHVDYEPASSVMTTKALLGEEFAEPSRRRSLLELAGLESEGVDRQASRRPPGRSSERMDTTVDEQPPRPPANFPEPAADPSLASDEDYYKLFEDEIERDRP